MSASFRCWLLAGGIWLMCAVLGTAAVVLILVFFRFYDELVIPWLKNVTKVLGNLPEYAAGVLLVLILIGVLYQSVQVAHRKACEIMQGTVLVKP